MAGSAQTPIGPKAPCDCSPGSVASGLYPPEVGTGRKRCRNHPAATTWSTLGTCWGSERWGGRPRKAESWPHPGSTTSLMSRTTRGFNASCQAAGWRLPTPSGSAAPTWSSTTAGVSASHRRPPDVATDTRSRRTRAYGRLAPKGAGRSVNKPTAGVRRLRERRTPASAWPSPPRMPLPYLTDVPGTQGTRMTPRRLWPILTSDAAARSTSEPRPLGG
jgi:hypothetical protein